MQVSASDGVNTVTETVAFTVPQNLPPESQAIGPQDSPAEQVSTLDLSGFFTDPEGAALTYSISSQAAFVSLDGSVLSIEPPASAAGSTVNVQVSASDGVNTVTETVAFTVPQNLPPESQAIGPQDSPAEQVSTLDLSGFFTDPEGAALTYSISSQAAFVSLDGSVLSIEPPASAAGSTVNVQVSASDGVNTVTETVAFTVPQNLPPESQAIGPQDSPAEQVSTLDLSGFLPIRRALRSRIASAASGICVA